MAKIKYLIIPIILLSALYAWAGTYYHVDSQGNIYGTSINVTNSTINGITNGTSLPTLISINGTGIANYSINNTTAFTNVDSTLLANSISTAINRRIDIRAFGSTKCLSGIDGYIGIAIDNTVTASVDHQSGSSAGWASFSIEYVYNSTGVANIVSLQWKTLINSGANCLMLNNSASNAPRMIIRTEYTK